MGAAVPSPWRQALHCVHATTSTRRKNRTVKNFLFDSTSGEDVADIRHNHPIGGICDTARGMRMACEEDGVQSEVLVASFAFAVQRGKFPAHSQEQGRKRPGHSLQTG